MRVRLLGTLIFLIKTDMRRSADDLLSPCTNRCGRQVTMVSGSVDLFAMGPITNMSRAPLDLSQGGLFVYSVLR